MIFTRLTFTKYLSLFYIIGLAFTYFSKKKRYGFENKYYSVLINLNVYGLILHIIAENASYYYTPIISEIVFKGILFYFIIYSTYFLSFIFDEVDIKNNQKIIKIAQIICVICCVLATILPSELHRDIENMVFYTYGPDTKVAYIHGFVTLISLIIFLIVKYKQISKKKRFYILGYTIGLMMAAVVQRINPEIAMSIYVECFLCTMMYFTIENPDVEVGVYNAAKNQAEKAGRAKDDFLSSMSHELRTPLNAIIGLSQLIEERSQDPETASDAKDIVVASQDLLELINSILNVNKIDNNSLDLTEENYNLKNISKELIKMSNIRLNDKNIKLITNISEEIPDILYGDKDKIRTIITNLLSNAIKYTDEGTIDFNISCVNKNDICKLEIVVKDTGRGMSKEQLDNIFTKFYRREEDKDSDIKGVGLGLAITKSLVDLMEGTINVESIEGSGTTFTVRINQKIIENNNIEVL